MKKVRETNVEQLAAPAETKRRIYNFLRNHPIGVLSTVDEDGGPRATVIYFSVDEDFVITFVTKKETKKHQNLQHDTRSMLVTYEATDQVTAQVSGHASVIEDTDEAHKAFSDMVKISHERSRAGTPPPITKLEAGDYVAYQLVPHEIRLAVFTRPDPGGYDMYETIYFTSQDDEV